MVCEEFKYMYFLECITIEIECIYAHTIIIFCH